MNMTNEEIVRHYSQAKNKTRDIKVLADLNSTVPSRIRQILAEAGVEGVAAPKRIPERPRERAEVLGPPAESGSSFPEVYSQIETILAALPDSLPPGVRRQAAGLLSDLFAGYLEARLSLPVESITKGSIVQNYALGGSEP